MKVSAVLSLMMLASQSLAMRVIIQTYYKDNGKVTAADPRMFELKDADAEQVKDHPPKDTKAAIEGNSIVGQFLTIKGDKDFDTKSEANTDCRKLYDEITKEYTPQVNDKRSMRFNA